MPLRVLIADDHPDHVKILAEFFQKGGHSVDVVQDGQRAVEMARRMRNEQSPYHVVVLDFMMAGLDGLQVCKALRGDLDQVPIAMVTAYGQTAITLPMQAQQFGVLDVIDKPIDLARFSRLLSAGETYAATLVAAPAHSSATGTVRMMTPRGTQRITDLSAEAQPGTALERRKTPSGLGQPQPPPAPPAASGRTGTGAIREHSGFYTMSPTTRSTRSPRIGSGLIPPPPTTTIRRSVTGSVVPPPRSTVGDPPAAETPSAKSTTCPQCQRSLVVPVKPTSYTTLCVHCGHLHRIDP